MMERGKRCREKLKKKGVEEVEGEGKRTSTKLMV